MSVSIASEILWVVLPYLALAIFVVGNLYRYLFDASVWTSKSSELLEKRQLRWGSLMFHFGLILVLLGHIGGIIIPASLTQSFGITDVQYHLSALVIGGASGTVCLAGLVLLSYRRISIRSVRSASSASDLLVLALLLVVMGIGLFNTLAYPTALFQGFDYRATIAPWFRGLFTFQPDASLMNSVPLSFQAHILATLALIVAWPFTRLVHVWTIPVRYLSRPYIVYRAKTRVPVQTARKK